MAIDNIIAFLGLSLAVFTGVASIIVALINQEKRRYGLERDFAHMKRDYEQIVVNLSEILKELDSGFDSLERTLIEIKSLLNK